MAQSSVRDSIVLAKKEESVSPVVQFEIVQVDKNPDHIVSYLYLENYGIFRHHDHQTCLNIIIAQIKSQCGFKALGSVWLAAVPLNDMAVWFCA